MFDWSCCTYRFYMVRIERTKTTTTEQNRDIDLQQSRITTPAPERTAATIRSDHRADPAYHAYMSLRIGYVVAPLIAGVDKFFNALVDWPIYLAPWVANIFGAQNFMYFVGVVEIIAAIGVAVMPRVFAYVVSAWMFGIVINLLTIPGYLDIALRDVGLALGALALGRLAHVYDRPIRSLAKRSSAAPAP